MKKQFYLPLVALALMFLGTACDDQLDINTDPLAATSVDANLLFPQVLINLSNSREADLDARTGNIAQHNEGAFGSISSYAFADRNNNTLVNNGWTTLYSSTVKNVSLLERTAAEAEEGTQDNILAQAIIMKSLIFWQATMLWEDVPYVQAADFVTALPMFDDQEFILRALIDDLNAALALIDDESAKITNGDLVYAGDMALWERAANSLKLKILMLIANVDPGSVEGEISRTVNSPLIETVNQNMQLQYLDAPGNFNPFWNIFNNFAGGINPTWWTASEALFDVMENVGDPRLGSYYHESRDQSTWGTGEFGPRSPAGEYVSAGNTAAIVSTIAIRPDRPDTYITAAEVQLYKAEAILKGYAEGDAQAAFEAGVSAGINEFDGTQSQPRTLVPADPISGEISDEDEMAYISSLGDVTVDKIHEQLYIANFLRMPDSWAEWRRTKFPDLDTPNGSNVEGIVRRFYQSTNEDATNPNVPADVPLDTPMWYEGE